MPGKSMDAFGWVMAMTPIAAIAAQSALPFFRELIRLLRAGPGIPVSQPDRGRSSRWSVKPQVHGAERRSQQENRPPLPPA